MLKVLRAGYYWPTMVRDSIDFVKKCWKCQQHANFHDGLAEELSTIMSPWPFIKWRIDLLVPFPLAWGQVKYLIIAINFFTKWLEAELLSSIMAVQAQKFIWRNIFTHFVILESLIINNRTQFIDQKFQGFLEAIKCNIISPRQTSLRPIVKSKL